MKNLNNFAELETYDKLEENPDYESDYNKMTMLKNDVATRFNYVKVMLPVLINGHDAVKEVIY